MGRRPVFCNVVHSDGERCKRTPAMSIDRVRREQQENLVAEAVKATREAIARRLEAEAKQADGYADQCSPVGRGGWEARADAYRHAARLARRGKLGKEKP